MSIRRLGSIDYAGVNAGTAPTLFGAPGGGAPFALIIWGGSQPPQTPIPLQVLNFGNTEFKRGLVRIRPAAIGNLPAGFLLTLLVGATFDRPGVAELFETPPEVFPVFIRSPAVCYDFEILPHSHGAVLWGLNLDGALNNQIFSFQLEFYGVS